MLGTLQEPAVDTASLVADQLGMHFGCYTLTSAVRGDVYNNHLAAQGYETMRKNMFQGYFEPMQCSVAGRMRFFAVGFGEPPGTGEWGRWDLCSWLLRLGFLAQGCSMCADASALWVQPCESESALALPRYHCNCANRRNCYAYVRMVEQFHTRSSVDY